MAKLVNKVQPIVQGVKNPKAVYSRQVLVQLFVEGGVGNSDWGVTPPLGNRVRLLSVDVWLQPTTQGGFIECTLKVQTGAGKKFSAYQISEQWAPVMDSSMLLKVGLMIYCCGITMRFDMDKLYTGESQRFGLFSQNNGNVAYTVIGAFQISEG